MFFWWQNVALAVKPLRFGGEMGTGAIRAVPPANRPPARSVNAPVDFFVTHSVFERDLVKTDIGQNVYWSKRI